MNIVLTNPVFYNNGTSGASGVVGYESRHNRVVRYNLSSPDIGANKIDLSFTGNWEGAGTLPNTLYFFVGTDPNDHANAGSTSAKTGELTRKSGTYEYYGSADILLMPNTTYYVWVFPSSTTFGWLYWGKNTGDASVETYGGAISTVATGSATLGQTVSLKVTKYVSDYTHTIKYTIGGQSGTICTKSSATSVPWTPSIDLAWQIKNAEHGVANLTVETYRGNTLIGTMQGIKFNLIVPQGIVPSVSATFEDPSNGYSVFGVHVQNVSYFKVNTTSSGAYGSTIQKTDLRLNGETYTGGVVAENGTIELSVIVTDSRGRTATWVTNVEVAEYSYPTASVSASRCDEDGTPNETGEYANVTISAKTFNVNGRNEANATLNYGQQTQSIQVPIGTRDVSVIVPAPSVSAMQISASVTDRLGSSALAVMTLSVGYATLDFLAGGKGIAFGTTAKEPGFTCAMNANFTGGLQLGGKALVDVIYPVGSIYMSANNVSPAAFLGGTWERIEDRFLLAAGSSYAAGATGGEAAHTLTVNEMPSHVGHLSANDSNWNGTGGLFMEKSVMQAYGTTGRGWTLQADNEVVPAGNSVGGGAAHNNMPPYLAVYIWKRIS